MTQYVVDENGFLIPYELWISERETAEKSPNMIDSLKQTSQSIQPLVECPICKVSVMQNRLDKHIMKVHPNSSTTPIDIEPIEQPPSAQSELGDNHSHTVTSEHTVSAAKEKRCTMPQDDVIIAFNILLEAIENTIEDLNQRGGQAFQKRDYAGARELTEKGNQITMFREKIVELEEKWGNIFSNNITHTYDHPTQKRPKSQEVTDRLQRGLRTPEKDYYVPILQTLVDMGGAGSGSEVVEYVGKVMKPIFNEWDYGALPSDNEPRWIKAVHWARLKMVRKGWLASDSPRGTWQITAAGRRWLAAAKK